MSLVGNLEDLGLGEILQIVSLSRRSGVLSLESRQRTARIVFRSGQVVRASSTTCQQQIGELLIQRGVIDAAVLTRALGIQAEEGYRQLLGAIMIERFRIESEAIENVVREQIENVVYSLFAWAEGTFEFELQEVAEGDAARLDPVQFMLSQGLNPQYLAMEGSRIIDEQRHLGEGGLRQQPPPVPTEENLDLVFDLLREPSPQPAHANVSEKIPTTPEHPFPSPPPAPRGPAAVAAPLLPLVLVDDDPATLEALTELLEKEGYRVFAMARGEDALVGIDNLYRDGIRPVAVVDLVMPRMDGTGTLGGLELLELVRNNFPELALVALSDFPREEARAKTDALAIPVVMKPAGGELCGPFPAFARELLAALSRGGGGAPRTSQVNIGDELRLEMGEEPALPAPPNARSIGVSHLRGMLEELNSPQLGGGIILLVLRFAAEFLSRGVVLLVKKESIQGLGQFGLPDQGGSADQRVRTLRIPRGEPSLFTPVLATRFPLTGEADGSPWSGYFLGQLGGERPQEVFVGPIVSEGEVVAVLYGDNVPGEKPIGETDSLEIFLGQVGVAMDKALLERRLQERATGGRS